MIRNPEYSHTLCIYTRRWTGLAGSLCPRLSLPVLPANQLQNLILIKHINNLKTTQTLEEAIYTLSENKADAENINRHEPLIQFKYDKKCMTCQTSTAAKLTLNCWSNSGFCKVNSHPQGPGFDSRSTLFSRLFSVSHQPKMWATWLEA